MKRKRKQNKLTPYKRTAKKILRFVWDETKTLLLIVLGVVLFFNWLDINIVGKITSKIGLTTQDKLSPLKEDEKAKLTVNVPARRAHVQTKDGKTKTYHGVRKVEATEMIDGTYKFKKKNLGFEAEVGSFVGVGDGLRLGMDVQWAYWKTWGIATGISIPAVDRTLDRLRLQVHVNYHPGFNLIPNTGVFIGADSKKQVIGGLRWRW